mgnify:CR=1 FL=1
MRDDIFILNDDGTPYRDKDGAKVIDVSKVIGKNYGRGWFTNCNARYRFFEGARSTKKSYNMIGYECVFKIITCPLRNIVVLRQDDVNNRQSTFEQICKCIGDLGIEKSFLISKNPLVIEYRPTGQKILFRGLNNPTGLNGITFSVGYWTDSYIDEAYEVESYDDFRKLDGSMRGKLPEGLFHQITCCLNPWNQDTWIYNEFYKGRLEDDFERLDNPNVAYMDYYDPNFIGPYGKGIYLHKSTYKCNEFRDKDIYDAAAMEMRKKSPQIYSVEFLGMWGNSTETVYPEFNDSLVYPIQHFIGGDSANGGGLMFSEFAIGIDTGLSDGAGHAKKVKSGENPSKVIRSATAMTLCAITSDLSTACVIDEYFHANDYAVNEMNTDGDRDNLTEPQLMDKIVEKVIYWMNIYGQGKSILMRGNFNIYVDSADLGFRQGLEIKFREKGIYNVHLYGSTKLPIQSRIDFTRLLMAYGDFHICDKCKNLMREFKNTRRGEKGEPRAGNDHACDSEEYALTPLYSSLRRWKTFKVH